MARKEKIVILEDGGESKKFKIRQMSATASEWFFFQMVDELSKAGMLKQDVDQAGGVSALLGILARRQDMLDKLIESVSRVHEGGIESQLNSENIDGYIEDFKTLIMLRKEAFMLNGFFQNADLSGLTSLKESQNQDITIKRKK